MTINTPLGFSPIVLIVRFLLTQSCRNDDITPLDPLKCYEGTVVERACPSLAYIQVTNASIGESWKSGDTIYRNMITMRNYPDSLVFRTRNKVYFTVDVDATQRGINCEAIRPCPAIVFPPRASHFSMCKNSIAT